MSNRGPDSIDWLGHASFRLRGEAIVYIDPWKITSEPRNGDLILLTHHHYDHFSMEDILKVAREGATIIAPAPTVAEIEGWENVRTVEAGDQITIAGVNVEAVPAYNTNKKYHPREKGGLGYIVELNGERIYHCGDSDPIDEMREMRCDGVLIPVSGTYVMTPREAVAAIEMLKPDWAIPMHYGTIVGESSDAAYFAEHAACNVVIKEPVT